MPRQLIWTPRADPDAYAKEEYDLIGIRKKSRAAITKSSSDSIFPYEYSVMDGTSGWAGPCGTLAEPQATVARILTERNVIRGKIEFDAVLFPIEGE